MGLKKGKYAYVEVSKDRYVKLRVLKSRAKDDASRYIPLGVVTRRPPRNATVLRLSDLPNEVVSKISKG